MPGVLDYLRDAHRLGLKVGLASSSSCAWVEGHLVRLGLREYFDCVRARDDVSITKPDPALFLSAVETLGVQPCEAIAFEDSRNGLIAARRAGLHCVAVPELPHPPDRPVRCRRHSGVAGRDEFGGID